MATNDENVDKLKNLIEILDSMKAEIKPESSLLLKNMSERFSKLQSEAQSILDDLTGVSHTGKKTTVGTAPGQTKVYISLFQADPENIKAWEKTIRRISEYSLSRPIYRKPEHVLQMIRTRPDPRKEAYAEVTITEGDLIHGYAGKKETDINDNELLTVKEGSMKPNHVLKFVHGDQIYKFVDEKLVLASDDDDDE